MAGRPRKPTAVKRLQGTLQKCRANPAEPLPKVPLKDIEPPESLTENAKSLWRFSLSQAPDGLLTALDFGVFEQWCSLYAFACDLRDSVARDGAVIVDEKGNAKANPVLKSYNAICYTLKALENEMGFTPAGRTKVAAADSKGGKSNGFIDL